MKKPFQFEVEQALEISARALVFARCLGDSDFQITAESQIGGCPVSGVDIPRALDARGQQRENVFTFELKDKEDLKKFSKGKRVELLE